MSQKFCRRSVLTMRGGAYTIESYFGWVQGSAFMSGQTERENISTHRFSFPRDARLHRPCEYQKIFQQGSKAVGRSFICYVHRQEGEGSKLGFAVSRKVGNAVVRNRVKRRLREFFRTHLPLFRSEAQVVFVARAEAARLSHQETSRALEQLLKSGGVL